MKEIEMPIDIENEISLFYYEKELDSTKLKINLKQNVLIFILNGTKEIYLENKIKFTNNEFAIINSTKCLMTEKKQNNSKTYKSLLLFYNNQIIEDFIVLNKLKIKLNTIKNEYVNFKHDKFTSNFKNSLIEISKSNLKENNNLLKNKLYELFYYLIEIYPHLMLEFISLNQNKEDIQFKIKIENNIFNNLDLNELAYISNMSISTFKRKFVAIYGITPKKYMLSKRMDYAKKMLNYGIKSNLLFEKIGYLNLQTFIRAYTNYYGHPPNNN